MTGHCFSQEITPRAWWPAPKGTSLFVFGFAHQAGDVITDASLPIEDADSRSNSVIVGYRHTVSMFGRTTKLQVELPFSSGSTRANLQGLPARRNVPGPDSVRLLVKLALEGLQANLRPFQKGFLLFEFLAADQVHFFECIFQHGTKLRLDIFTQLRRPGRKGFREPGNDFVDFSQVDHRVIPAVDLPACHSRR